MIMGPIPLTDEEKMKLDASVVLDIEAPSSEPTASRTPLYLKADRKDTVLKTKIPAPSPPADRSPHNSATGWLASVNKRQNDLTNLQIFCRSKMSSISRDGTTNKLTLTGFCELFSSQEVLQNVFQLFEPNENEKIPSSVLIEFLNDQLKSNGWELKSVLESAIYILAEENELNYSVFARIFSAIIVQQKMYLLIDKHKEGSITLETFMDFIKDMTMPKLSDRLSPEQVDNAEKIFSSYIKEGCQELTFEDFKKVIPCKNPFFAERAFRLMDKDGSNSISTVEFRETLEHFKNQDNKILFLFQIYDLNGDGRIHLTELRDVLAACSEENGMKFSDEQLDQLTIALYEDAENCDDVGEEEEDENRAELGISFEKLKAQMLKQPGLLENLSISLERFLVPTVPVPVTNKSYSFTLPLMFSKYNRAYFQNNYTLVLFLTAFSAINLILFITRAIQFSDSNGLYILARAAGQTLNFNCSFVVVLMLRNCITWLRRFGWASILPLDNHVYLHKVCGISIVFFSVLHTVMHLINIPLNVATKPSNRTNQMHSSAEWLFTSNPRMFGLIDGCAALTGWFLVLVLAIMFVFSLPFVRKSGKFEIFYWTHILYYPFWILLIFHGPRFWQWFIAPALLFIFIEKMLQFMKRWSQKGRTFISSADLLPSRVTHLTIKKPPNFHFHPGDYVFVQIPSLANYEWHPFTISSAPELPDHICLHIRCAGGWTNSLYEFFEKQMMNKCCDDSIAADLSNCDRCSKPLKPINPRDSRFSKLRETLNIRRSKEVALRTSSSESPEFTKIQFSSISDIQRHKRYTTSRIVRMPVPMTSDSETNAIPKEAHRRTMFRNRKTKNVEPTPRDIFAPETKKDVALRSKSLDPLKKSYDSEIRALPNRRVQKSVSFFSITEKSDPVEIGQSPQTSAVEPGDFIQEAVNGGLDMKCITPPLLNVIINHESSETKSVVRRSRPKSIKLVNEELQIDVPIEIIIDGPFGAPSSHIFRAEHAVLIAAGIGVTPFASILQSIMNRYYAVKQTCPSCQHNWVGKMPESIMNLKKVDFFWINRDQRSFEWFVNLLSQLEVQQAEFEGYSMEHFLDLHMYITSALSKTDMKAVGLQMAMDLLYAKEKRDLITGLKTRTNAGRPNWSKMFQKIQDENKGKVTVFYCGPPQLAIELKEKCNAFGFTFRKEIF